jgi:hypothetical protein
VPDLSLVSDPRFARIAVIGALVAALGLVGCGRKGGLDPPPGASVDPNVVVESGAPAGPPPPSAPQRRTPIDWLID